MALLERLPTPVRALEKLPVPWRHENPKNTIELLEEEIVRLQNSRLNPEKRYLVLTAVYGDLFFTAQLKKRPPNPDSNKAFPWIREDDAYALLKKHGRLEDTYSWIPYQTYENGVITRSAVHAIGNDLRTVSIEDAIFSPTDRLRIGVNIAIAARLPEHDALLANPIKIPELDAIVSPYFTDLKRPLPKGKIIVGE